MALIKAIRFSLLIATCSFLACIPMFSFDMYPSAIYMFLIFVLSFSGFLFCSIKDAQGMVISYVKSRREPKHITFASKRKEQDKPMA